MLPINIKTKNRQNRISMELTIPSEEFDHGCEPEASRGRYTVDHCVTNSPQPGSQCKQNSFASTVCVTL